MSKKIPFFRREISNNDRDYIDNVVDEVTQNAVEDLEEDFKNYIGTDFALATSHGTSALHLAMLALDLKRGDKVLCSVNSFPAVPEVVRHFDAEPIFIDIDEDTYNINLDKLESYLEDNSVKKLKAVIVTHMAGLSVDIDRLLRIADIYNIKVVEDASEALGSTFNGEKIGSFQSDLVCFSFNTHLKNSICNGGMLTTKDEDLYDRAKLLRDHAMVVDEGSLDYVYDVVDIGSKYTMSMLDAAFINSQLKSHDIYTQRVKDIAQRYSDALDGVEHVRVPVKDKNHSYSLYIIKIDKNRDSFAREMEAQGISVGLHYIPLHLMSYYKNKYMLRINDYPKALTSFQQVLSIPIYAAMEDSDVEYVIDTIKNIAKNRI